MIKQALRIEYNYIFDSFALFFNLFDISLDIYDL